MGAWSARQQAALGAVAAAVFLIVGFLLPGSPPNYAASPLEVVPFFEDNHKKVLIATVLVEIGVLLLIAVLAQLAMVLRAAGEATLAAVVGIAGAASVAILGSGIALFGALGQLATQSADDRAAVRPLYQLIQFAQTPWFWTTLAVVVSVGLAATRGVFPRWAGPVNGVIGVLLVLGGISVKASGVFAAGTGLFCMLGGIAFLVFMLELGFLLWKSEAMALPAAQPARM
jgi:hypothetical protein